MEAFPERLRPYRYLLSPTLDTQRFDAAYLSDQLAARAAPASSVRCRSPFTGRVSMQRSSAPRPRNTMSRTWPASVRSRGTSVSVQSRREPFASMR